MSNTLELIKKQEYKSFFRKKLLRKHITSLLEDPDLVYLYIDFEEYALS